MNNCPKCNSFNIKTEKSAINGKEVCTCQNCNNTWLRERISIIIDKDGTEMIELETQNPFESVFKGMFYPFKNGAFPFFFQAYYPEDKDDDEEE